jgi:hypothetical protein
MLLSTSGERNRTWADCFPNCTGFVYNYRMDRTKDQDKTREQLISELADLRRRVTGLEASVVAHKQAVEGFGELPQDND